MKAILSSFRVFIRQIIRDDMLWAVCLAPFLAGLFFRFAIPAIDRWQAQTFGSGYLLAEYYLLFDLMLNLLTPYMFCFAAAMVMLTEYDENIAVYMAITPVGKSGYILSRLLIPAGLAVPAGLMVTAIFSLTSWSIGKLTVISLLSGLLSLAVALLVVSFSNNRVEGMALAKLSGLMMMGLPIPFFIVSKHQYWFSALPSFWIARLSIGQNYIYSLPATITSVIWILILYRKFARKLSG